MTKQQLAKLNVGDVIKINYPGSMDHNKKGYVHRIEGRMVYFCSDVEQYSVITQVPGNPDPCFGCCTYKHLEPTGLKFNSWPIY